MLKFVGAAMLYLVHGFPALGTTVYEVKDRGADVGRDVDTIFQCLDASARHNLLFLIIIVADSPFVQRTLDSIVSDALAEFPSPSERRMFQLPSVQGGFGNAQQIGDLAVSQAPLAGFADDADQVGVILGGRVTATIADTPLITEWRAPLTFSLDRQSDVGRNIFFCLLILVYHIARIPFVGSRHMLLATSVEARRANRSGQRAADHQFKDGLTMAQDAEMTGMPPTSEPVCRSGPAERMRLHRQRRRRGLRCLTIELHEKEIDGLIRRGLLQQETRNNSNAILEALYAHFERTLGQTP
jgi:hypothetical protein